MAYVSFTTQGREMFLVSDFKDSFLQFNGEELFTNNFKESEYFTTHYSQYKLALDKYNTLIKDPLDNITTENKTLTN